MQSCKKFCRDFLIRAIYIPKDLTTRTHVFVRRDSVKAPLHHTYSGPLHVISRHAIIDRNGHKETADLERLKAAFVDSDYRTGDSFTKSPVSVPDTPRRLENGDQNN